MKKLLVVSAILASSVLFAEEAKTPPVIPDSVRVKILKLELDQSKLMSEYQQIQARMQEIQKQYMAIQPQITDAQEEAYKAAKVDKKDWSIDMKEVTFVAIPKPPEQPKAAEVKK